MKPFAIHSIVAPTDLSESSIPALRYARLFADRFAAKVIVMYADPIAYPAEVAGPARVAIKTTAEHEARLRKEVERHAGPLMEHRPYDTDVSIGQPVSSILASARAHDADLIVMGTHLRHGWRRALLGSVSEGVLDAADRPVLTVASRDGYVGAAPYAITHILCPINFTEVARDALRTAAGIAEAFGARVTVVHVVEGEYLVDVDGDERRMRQWIGPELENVISYRELIVRGGPAERVLDCVDDVGADLLVIGAQQKLFRDVTVIGTTSERLVRFASCPVLVVPRPIARRRARYTVEEEAMTVGG